MPYFEVEWAQKWVQFTEKPCSVMLASELCDLSPKYIARDFWKCATLDCAGLSRIREHDAYLLRRFPRRGERDCGFAGEDAEGERLLEIQPYGRIGMAEVADRNVLPDVELKIAAARG